MRRSWATIAKGEAMISFFVPGLPKPGGSKRAFYNKALGRALIVDACDNKDWKTAVKMFAVKAYQGPVLHGPLSLSIEFRMPRPKSHYRTGAHAGELKPNAPMWHTSKPDRTKLVRSTEDSLKGIIWADDSQVCDGRVMKIYFDPPGAAICIEERGVVT